MENTNFWNGFVKQAASMKFFNRLLNSAENKVVKNVVNHPDVVKRRDYQDALRPFGEYRKRVIERFKKSKATESTNVWKNDTDLRGKIKDTTKDLRKLLPKKG